MCRVAVTPFGDHEQWSVLHTTHAAASSWAQTDGAPCVTVNKYAPGYVSFSNTVMSVYPRRARNVAHDMLAGPQPNSAIGSLYSYWHPVDRHTHTHTRTHT